jgi:hypothetical protein
LVTNTEVHADGVEKTPGRPHSPGWTWVGLAVHPPWAITGGLRPHTHANTQEPPCPATRRRRVPDAAYEKKKKGQRRHSESERTSAGMGCHTGRSETASSRFECATIRYESGYRKILFVGTASLVPLPGMACFPSRACFAQRAQSGCLMVCGRLAYAWHDRGTGKSDVLSLSVGARSRVPRRIWLTIRSLNPSASSLR